MSLISTIMDIARMLNVTILACLLILTGCLGLFDDDDVIDGADGEDTDSGSTTVVNNYYNNTTTALTGTPPEVHVVEDKSVSPVPLYDSNQEIIGYSGYSVTLYYSMLDVDGTITTAGIDIDLNGVVDVPVGYPRGHVNLTIPISEWETCWLGDEICEESMITTVAFIATDDDGLSTVEIMTFFGPTYDDGGWNGGSSMYVLTAGDHTDDIEDDAGMMTLTFGNGNDLDWALLQIEIVKDSVPTTCDNPSDNAGDSKCVSTQHGGADNESWEKGETIIITSNNGAFCLEQDCTLTVRIKSGGDVIMSAAVDMI
jgi:hypothetical protein